MQHITLIAIGQKEIMPAYDTAVTWLSTNLQSKKSGWFSLVEIKIPERFFLILGNTKI